MQTMAGKLNLLIYVTPKQLNDLSPLSTYKWKWGQQFDGRHWPSVGCRAKGLLYTFIDEPYWSLLMIHRHSKFNTIFQHHNTVLTPQDKYSVTNLLNSYLKIPPEKKTGMFQINCKDCKKIYRFIGKTKWDLETRVKEHFRDIKNGEIEKSAVAEYVWKEKMQWIINQFY